MDILTYQNHLANRMISKNPDVTIGEYWSLANIEPEPIMIISSEMPVRLPKRYYPPNRKRRGEVVVDPSPITRPLAIYDNRGHNRIIEEYS